MNTSMFTADPSGSTLSLLSGLRFQGGLTIDPGNGSVTILFTLPSLKVQIVPCERLGTSTVEDPDAVGVYCHVHADAVYIGQGALGTRPAVSNAKHFGDDPGMTILATRTGTPWTGDEVTYLEASWVEGARRIRVPRRNGQMPASPTRLKDAQVQALEMGLITTVLVSLLAALMPTRGIDPDPRQVDQMVQIIEDSDAPMTQAGIAAEMARRGWPVGTQPVTIVARNIRDYVLPSPLATVEATDLGLPGRTFYVAKGRTYTADAIAQAHRLALGLTEAGEAA